VVCILAIEDDILISWKFQIEVTANLDENLVALVQQIIPLSSSFLGRCKVNIGQKSTNKKEKESIAFEQNSMCLLLFKLLFMLAVFLIVLFAHQELNTKEIASSLV